MRLDRIDKESLHRQLQDSMQRMKFENDKLSEKVNELTDHSNAM
jgi:hypothetical protein